MKRTEINKLKTGSKHYMAYVGPARKYEIIGNMQKNLLVSSGLLPEHKLCDIGCGSLRAGLHLIPYLDSGNYFGIEPNKWLVDEGLSVHNINNEKAPTFYFGDDFNISFFNESFDYMIAQSIFSHASQDQIKKCVSEVKKNLKPTGVFLATFVLGKKNYTGKDWVYPGCVRYTNDHVIKMINDCGMNGIRANYDQKNNQTWYVIYNKEAEDLALKISKL